MEEQKPPQGSSLESGENLNLNILFADDQESNRRLTARILEIKGCRVETVASGQELLDRLFNAKPGEFGLVITDYDMPVRSGVSINGVDAIRKIRENESFKRLPIILCSGTLDSEIQEAVSNMEGLCLAKPFQAQDLFNIIKRAIAKPESGGAV